MSSPAFWLGWLTGLVSGCILGVGLSRAIDKIRALGPKSTEPEPAGIRLCGYQWSDVGTKDGSLGVLRCNLPDGHPEREHHGTLVAVVHKENRKELLKP